MALPAFVPFSWCNVLSEGRATTARDYEELYELLANTKYCAGHSQSPPHASVTAERTVKGSGHHLSVSLPWCGESSLEIHELWMTLAKTSEGSLPPSHMEVVLKLDGLRNSSPCLLPTLHFFIAFAVSGMLQEESECVSHREDRKKCIWRPGMFQYRNSMISLAII